MIIHDVEVIENDVVIGVDMPNDLDSKDIMSTFVNDIDENIHGISQCLGGSLTIKGYINAEMGMLIGVLAQRFGAKKLIHDNECITGGYSRIDMTTQMQPGMIVEFIGSSMFKDGARAVVMNVGKDSVNIADNNATSRSRRDTAWTRLENVKAVGWEFPPKVIR